MESPLAVDSPISCKENVQFEDMNKLVDEDSTSNTNPRRPIMWGLNLELISNVKTNSHLKLNQLSVNIFTEKEEIK